jgi:hypothetical protein
MLNTLRIRLMLNKSTSQQINVSFAGGRGYIEKD